MSRIPITSEVPPASPDEITPLLHWPSPSSPSYSKLSNRNWSQCSYIWEICAAKPNAKTPWGEDINQRMTIFLS